MAIDKKQLVNLDLVGIVLSVPTFPAEYSSALKMFWAGEKQYGYIKKERQVISGLPTLEI